MTLASGQTPIRPAATLVLWRHGGHGPEVLMGQRGSGAAFMPQKFVFPGGRVDEGEPPRPGHLAPLCQARLTSLPLPGSPAPDEITGAAIRELGEETGLSLHPGSALRFIFRAITPEGSPRRFDARFLLAEASAIATDPDDFAAASGELAQLQWLPIARAQGFDLPFITEIVLAEVLALIAGHDQPGVPFFDNSGPKPRFARIGPLHLS